MTKIKLCGLTRPCDIETANELMPDYIGFVFAQKSRRYIEPDRALHLKRILDPEISAVGVFVNEAPEHIAALLNREIIDVAQLHGNEDGAYVRQLRTLTDRPLIQAFRIDDRADICRAKASSADLILLDSSSGGTGTAFDWRLLQDIDRPYFLAGGLDPDNVREAISLLHPYGVDVSSGIETNKQKDTAKMAAFVAAVRKEDTP